MAGLSGYGRDDESFPIIPPVEQTVQSGGMYGAIAALLALRIGPDRPGELFDVSAQAAAFQGTEQLFACWVYRGEVLHRLGGGYATVVPLPRWQITGTDGAYIYALGLLPRTQGEWNDLRSWMRDHDAVEDLDEPAYDDIHDLRGRNPFDIRPAGDHAAGVITRFLQSIDADSAYRDGQAIKMGWAKIFQPQDTLGEEQFRGRRFFHRTAWPGTDESYLVPSFPTILTGRSVADEHTDVVRPPAVGEHTEAVRAEWLAPSE
jgi:crotonobetainyl-CoA:carnitine CoA-transferase CaiB-like acyl-CoA transferase